MMHFTLALGCLMFIHFGCAILKHEANRSDIFLKLSLLSKLVLSVLIIRASILENYSDLLFSLIGNTAVNMALSLYIWAHGITFLDIGNHMHKTKFGEMWQSIRKTF
jgi:hypothetical protein